MRRSFVPFLIFIATIAFFVWFFAMFLTAASELAPEYPNWMLGRQGGGRRPAPFVPASA